MKFNVASLKLFFCSSSPSLAKLVAVARPPAPSISMILIFFMVEKVRDHVRIMGGKRMTRSETEATAVSAIKLACLSRHFDGTERSQTPSIGRQMMILTTVMAMQNPT